MTRNIDFLKNITEEQKDALLTVLKMGAKIELDPFTELNASHEGMGIIPEYMGMNLQTEEYPVTAEGLTAAIDDIIETYDSMERGDF